MVLFSFQYGPFCKPKWCFSQDNKTPFKYKLLTFNILHEALIIRVFAAEERICPQICAYFSGYIRKLRRKNQNTVTI